MYINLTKVTPELAAAWLQKNPRNRNLNDKLVRDYARQMSAGGWAANGETIKIASNGDLLDGQHRLSAIVQSGVTLELVVVTGLPAATQNTMDTGRKRVVADVLAISGETNSNVLAAVARRVWLWDNGNRRFTTASNPSPNEVIAMIEKYPSLRRSAEIGARTNSVFRPAPATVTGMAHHLVLQVDQDDTALFFAQLGHGTDLKTGHPVLTLRDRLIRDRVSMKKVPFHVGVALYIRAWNAVREGRTLTFIQHAPEASVPTPV